MGGRVGLNLGLDVEDVVGSGSNALVYGVVLLYQLGLIFECPIQGKSKWPRH